MDKLTIDRIKQILNIAEQGVRTIPYGKVEVMNDGPGGIAQVTLSVGFTQYGGNLGKVIETYLKRGGKHEELRKYKMSDNGLPRNADFKKSLKDAGADPVMQETQEELYVTLYIGPAIAWGEKEGFKEPLSYLVIADSFLHSGSILTSLRNKFAEKTPIWGGDEKKWIKEYVTARQNWLATHSNKLLNNTVYRTKYYKELIAMDDWGLEQTHTIAMNGMKPNLLVA
jgi:chitosanase